MKFHNVHGSAVAFSESKTSALRSDTHFCNGLVFTDQPIRVGQKVCTELSCTHSWSGALRIGFTVHDPSKLNPAELPKYSLPHFAKKDGYWIRPISESLTGDGYHLMFYISADGHVQFFVNNEHKGALLVGLPVDRAFWVIFDIYGNTKGITLIKSDDAPKEITARGPVAIQAFESACTTGMRPVYRTRLMLVGQDGVGKTSLRKALLGRKPVKEERETCGIDMSTSCTFTVGSREGWKEVKAGTHETVDASNQNNTMSVDMDILEEEYNQALATNIVQELLYQRRRKTSSSHRPIKPTAPSRDSQRNSASGTKKPISRTSSSTPVSAKFSEIPCEVFKEVPNRVVELVQKMLETTPVEIRSQDSTVSMVTKPADGTNMVLNIWDFAGREMYYITHQVFLTSRAVYVFVFNLTHNLEQEQTESSDQEQTECFSTLEYLDFWLRSIFAHASTSHKKELHDLTFSPQVLIVGTHKDCLHEDKSLIDHAVDEKFSQIQEFLVGKPYVQHLVTPFYAVNNSLDDTKLTELRHKVEEISCIEPYIGERMPLCWMKFEQEITSLANTGANYASYDQIAEIAGNHGITDFKEVMTMLEFYHDLGVIIYYGRGKTAIDNLLRNTVILSPQWLIDKFKHVVSSDWKPEDKWNLIRDKWTRLQDFGILEEALLETLWHEAREQKPMLLGLLEKFDLICQRLPSVAESQASDLQRSYYVPARLSRYMGTNKLYITGDNTVTFYIDCHGFLPNGLFQRIMTRTTRWSQDIGGQNPYFLYKQVIRFFLDVEHDFVLEMSDRKYSRIKVVILRVSEANTTREEQGVSENISAPSPDACARVRNFLESSLSDLREMWMKRISYSMVVTCPCQCVCETHKQEGCHQEQCLHFLNLDECLANKVVMCDHRRIKTTAIKKCYPEPLTLGFNGPVLPPMSLTDTCGNIEKHCPTLPGWVKSVAKLLNTGEEGKGWNALSKELGYKQNQVNTFNDDLNPGLALLADWIMSSGNTGLSVDMLTVYLEKLEREDIVEIIQKAQELEHEPAQIFLSYQWDSQDEVKALRDRLECSGYSCWMDIGQLGGGDQLYTKIDEALRQCKAVISCVSPKYVVSHHCMKELSLADLLRKPIIPVMIQQTPWPPPGGMALIFSQLVYINMKGIGGHGGTGIHADKKDKYREIIQRISQHATPDHAHETETDQESKKSQYIDHDLLSSNLSALEYADRYSTASSLNSFRHTELQPIPLQTYNQQALHEREARQTYRPVEQANVSQCRVCAIL